MPEQLDFSKLPWTNQRELMFHFVKDFTEKLRENEGRFGNILMDALAKSLIETVGEDRVAAIIKEAVSTEIRSYLQIHGIRVSLPGTPNL